MWGIVIRMSIYLCVCLSRIRPDLPNFQNLSERLALFIYLYLSTDYTNNKKTNKIKTEQNHGKIRSKIFHTHTKNYSSNDKQILFYKVKHKSTT